MYIKWNDKFSKRIHLEEDHDSFCYWWNRQYNLNKN